MKLEGGRGSAVVNLPFLSSSLLEIVALYCREAPSEKYGGGGAPPSWFRYLEETEVLFSF